VFGSPTEDVVLAALFRTCSERVEPWPALHSLVDLRSHQEPSLLDTLVALVIDEVLSKELAISRYFRGFVKIE